jgi:hypothetical protein
MTQMAIAALGPWKPRTTETADDVKRYVEPFNAFAEKAHVAGIVALLHNEGFAIVRQAWLIFGKFVRSWVGVRGLQV